MSSRGRREWQGRDGAGQDRSHAMRSVSKLDVVERHQARRWGVERAQSISAPTVLCGLLGVVRGAARVVAPVTRAITDEARLWLNS